MTNRKRRSTVSRISVILALAVLASVFCVGASAAGVQGTGTCGSCGQTCVYTLAYEQWTENVHCVRHWCSNCGEDQMGGVSGEAHAYDSSGTCTKCGYYNSAYVSTCSHPSTYVREFDCAWYEYCSVCGELLNSGLIHTYVYGDWTYYNATRHKRDGVCSVCGSTTIAFGPHMSETRYEPYSEAQHSKFTYCAVCDSKLGNETRENHVLTTGNWQSLDNSQHERITSCSICGYEETEAAPHTDQNGDGLCDDCGHEMALSFSVTVPASLSLAVSETGVVRAADNARITNNSAGAVRIRSLTVTGENGWTVVPYTRNMADAKVNSKLIGFQVNGVGTGDGESALPLSADTWTIERGASLSLSYNAVVSATSAPIERVKVLTLCFIVGWAE